MRALPCGHVIDKSKTAVGDDCPYCVQIVERVEEYRVDGRAPSRARIEVFNLFFCYPILPTIGPYGVSELNRLNTDRRRSPCVKMKARGYSHRACTSCLPTGSFS